MSWVLGIDGGGTKTICVILDETGKVLGRGEAGPANYHSVGIESAGWAIQSAIGLAIASTNTLSMTPSVEAICLGLAGVDRPADREAAHSIVQQLQASRELAIAWALPSSRITICNDAFIALVGGVGHDVGVVAIAGTGSIVFGRNQQGCTRRVGGWGHILGDEGSAYHIAVSGMRAALRAYDGRGEATSLVGCLQQHLNLESVEDFIGVVYQQGWGVKEIAALAPIVDRAAAAGDEVAMTIIEQAVQELVIATQVVIDDLFRETELAVVTTGGVWQGMSKLHERFTAEIIKRSPSAKVIFPRYEPAYGAALLALNSAMNSSP